MEFLTTKQKKLRARRLFIAYALLTILVGLATYVLISTALGFDLFKGKDAVQNGLLFIDTRPSDAVVYLNGKEESNRTNAKYSVPESVYDVRLSKRGYRDWVGTAQIVGGTVEFLTYPRLLPLRPTTLTAQPHASLPTFLQSRDKQWLAMTTKEAPAQMVVYSLDNPTELARVLNVGSEITGGGVVTELKLVEWAGDNEYVLVRVSIANNPVPKYVMLHRERPADVIDVSALFPVTASDTVGLWEGKRDIVYIRRENGTILLGDIKDRSLSAQSIIADTVVQIVALNDNKALYTTQLGNQLLVRLYSDGKTYTVTSIPYSDKPVIMKAFGFNRNEYLIIAGEAFEKTYVYRNFEKSIASTESGRVAPFFTMPMRSSVADASRNNRFVMGSDGSMSGVYDLEQREFYRYELPVDKPAQLGWFDDARLYALDSSNRLSLMDFDGKNVYSLGESVLGVPYVNRDVSVVAFQTNLNANIRTEFVDIETATP